MMKSRFLLFLVGFCVAVQVLPQSQSQKAAVLVSATVQSSPARITLNWEYFSGTSSITIYRKLTSGTSWGSAIAYPASSDTQYDDNSVQVGTAYEYKIVRSAYGVTGTGYIASGIEVQLPDYRGKMILLVDNTLAPQMGSELNQLEYDLRADGWAVVRSDVSRTAPASSIRDIVVGHYNNDPSNVKGVYIVGHVPVPYSGNQAPDGHSEHVGAWPCDGYYGEMNGGWSDNSVNNNSSQRQANNNIPGDGKFDQNTFPSDVELQVGRVDLYDMPAFSQSEVQLVKNYLNRAHSFKIKGWTPLVRGLMFDNLQWVSSPIGGSGLRNMGPLVGPSNVTNAQQHGTPFHTLVNGESYLWTYSSGGGEQEWVGGELTFNGAGNIGTTQNYAANTSMGGVFNMACGSYFGDWDNKNNFLRAPIAKGDALTNVWAGIPAWYFHHMGIGDNIGHGTLLTMNNTSIYTPITEGWQGSIGKVHLGLHGDPSLRMQMIAPPTSLNITNAGGTASFNWSASTETVIGYHIYRFSSTGAITRLTTNPVTGTTYQNASIPFEAGRQYMVRAVKLQVNHSGSFLNLSLGAIGTAAGSASADCQGVVGGPAVPGASCDDGDACTANDTWNSNCQCVGTPTTITATITPAGPTSFCTGGSVVLNANTGSGLTYVWRLDGNTINDATSSSYTATQAGVYTVRVSNGSCDATSSGVTVTISSGSSATITAAGITTFCSGGSVLLNANTGSGLGYVWRRDGSIISGASSSEYSAYQSGVYTVTVSTTGCESTSSGITVTVSSAPSATITPAGPTSFCSGGSVVLNANSGSGLSYVWRRDGTTIDGATSSSYTASQAGVYTVRVNYNGCETTSSGVTVTFSSAPSATITPAGPTTFCSGGSVQLNANTGSGLSYVWRRDGNTINGANSSSYSAYQSGVYTVRVTNGGCETTSSGLTVTVSSALVATITPFGSTSFCNGGSVLLDANTGSGLAYVWRRDGSTINGATSSSYTATQSGVYTVHVSSDGCETTSPGITVTVSNAQAATITPAGPTTFCSGGSVGLNANTGSGLSYVWRRDGSTITGANSSSYSAYQSGVYTVRVTNGGCETTSLGVTVTVPSAPSSTITPAGPTSFCAGGNVVLNANSGSGLTYVWRRDGNTISGATSASFTASQSGVYTVRVSNNDCETTSSGVIVTVDDPPTANITPAGSTTFCTGGSVVLNANTGNGFTYVWRRDGNTITGATDNSYTATQAGVYTVRITSGGCQTTSSGITVSLSSTPVATITSTGGTDFCSGGSVILTANSGNGLSYAWFRNGNAINGAAGVSYTAIQSGEYTVQVSNANCSSVSSAMTVNVAAGPVATITPSGATTFCMGSSVVLNANEGSGLTYTWHFNGNTINGANGATYVAGSAGSYTVTVGNANCSATSAAVTINTSITPAPELNVEEVIALCAGDSVLISTDAIAGAQYSWTSNGIALSGSSEAIIVSQAGMYGLQTIVDGCVSNIASVEVSVNDLPLAAISADGPTMVCAGDTVILQATQDSSYTYTWSLGGNDIAEASNDLYHATIAGEYSITVSDGACENTSASITVITSPDLSVELSGPTGFCQGDSLTLTAAADSAYTYLWSVNGVQLINETTPSLTVYTSGDYAVTIGAGDCTATSEAVQVLASESPIADIVANGPTTFCFGDSVQLATELDGAWAYQWSLNGEEMLDATEHGITAMNDGAYTVAVTNGGCTIVSDEVFVMNLPLVSLELDGPASFCTGDSVTISAITDSSYSYTWWMNGSILTDDTLNSITVSETGEYHVSITDGECSASSDMVQVIASDPAEFQFAALGATTYCSGDSVSLAVIADSLSGYDLEWFFNGIDLGSDTDTLIVSASGAYTVIVSNGGCALASDTIDVLSLPLVSIELQGDTEFCEGSSVMMTAAVDSNYTYQWYANGDAITGAVEHEFEAFEAGAYSLHVEGYGCAAYSDTVLIEVLEVPEIDCYADLNEGLVGVEVLGGIGPFTFVWNGNDTLNEAVIPFDGPGSHSVTVTSENGCVETCVVDVIIDTDDDCIGIRAESQEFWSSAALLNNFNEAFPNSLTIGCGFRKLTLTSAESVSEFLPSSGPSQRLPFGTLVDPGASYGNSLAGELVTLKLNVRYDEMDAAFSSADILLKDAVVAGGTFQGMTVEEVMEEADKKIGGCFSWHSRAQLRMAINSINTGYAGGINSNGYLECPPQGSPSPEPIEVVEELAPVPATGTDLNTTAFPNPFIESTTIVISQISEVGRVVVEILSTEGVVLERIYEGDVTPGMELRLPWEAIGRARGVYFYRVISPQGIQTGRLVAQ